MDGLKGCQRNNCYDFKQSDELYREMIGDPNWRKPKDMTWHHHQDCKTMILVPKAINNNVPHSGGAANIRNKTC